MGNTNFPWASYFRRAQVMKNATLPPSKRSRIEHQMDKMIIFMFALLFAMCLVGATLFAIWTKSLSPKMWYLAPSQAPTAFNPSQPVLAGVYSFVTSFVLYGYLIPISLYVSLEMVKVCQACSSLSGSLTPALVNNSMLPRSNGPVGLDNLLSNACKLHKPAVNKVYK